MTGPLISVADLASTLDDGVIFDIRWALTDPDHGIEVYRKGHVPGARFVDLDHDLSAASGDGRHPLPSLAEFEANLGRLGLNGGDRAVVYDDAGGAIAARMWWMLVSVGHHDVLLLDGGYQAWVDGGFEVATGDAPEPEPASYWSARDFTGWVRHDQLEGRQIVDVRAKERYTGAVEPVDPKAGHIPGALNLPLTRNLDDHGHFLADHVLATLFGGLDAKPVVSCGSGVNACHTALAMILAGREMPDIYVGSFSDWSRRDLPVATGDQP